MNESIAAQYLTASGFRLSEVAELFDTNRIEILSSLPFSAAEIADKTSFRTLLILVDNYGGGFMFLPWECTDGCKIARLVGFRHAYTLIDEHGGWKMLIPARSTIVKLIKSYLIKKLTAEGYTAAQIAKATGVHTRTIFRHRAVARRRDEKRIEHHA